MDALYNHRSIRKYKSTTIPKAVVEKILNAGIRASTTGNMQVYSIVATTDETLKQELMNAHFGQGMVGQAPLVLTFCADFNRFSKWAEQRDASPGYDNFLSFYTASIDALLVAQNVALAAEENGLGICYLGTTTYMASTITKILKLPRLVVPVTTLTVGYPDEQPSLTDRLPLEAVVHNETYNDYTPDAIDKYYAEKENNEQYRQFVKENGKETLAQVFTDVRYKKDDNVAFSEAFLEVIKQQGFLDEE